jgi:hypothetical protein
LPSGATRAAPHRPAALFLDRRARRQRGRRQARRHRDDPVRRRPGARAGERHRRRLRQPRAATLPDDVRQRITAKRRAGDEEAATDPLNDPEVRAALASASFELLVGFQLTEDQLAYNATRSSHGEFLPGQKR